MSEMIKHPRALAIAQKGESCLWEMGDYLIEIAGKPNRESYGASAKIEEVSEELLAHGYQYEMGSLLRLRLVSHTFAPAVRIKSVSWNTHYEAGSPEMLTAIVSAAKAQGLKTVPKRLARTIMTGLEADLRAKRKGLSIKAKKAADRAEAKGDKAAAERNRERARKLKGAPRRDVSKRIVPKPEDVPLLVAKSKFAADSSGVAQMLRRMDKEITPHIDDLSKAFIVGSVEELLEIAELCRKLADKLNRNQTNKRSHLHAVA